MERTNDYLDLKHCTHTLPRPSVANSGYFLKIAIFDQLASWEHCITIHLLFPQNVFMFFINFWKAAPTERIVIKGLKFERKMILAFLK